MGQKSETKGWTPIEKAVSSTAQQPISKSKENHSPIHWFYPLPDFHYSPGSRLLSGKPRPCLVCTGRPTARPEKKLIYRVLNKVYL